MLSFFASKLQKMFYENEVKYEKLRNGSFLFYLNAFHIEAKLGLGSLAVGAPHVQFLGRAILFIYLLFNIAFFFNINFVIFLLYFSISLLIILYF